MDNTTTPEYIKLISSDLQEFYIERKVAILSPFIKNILSSPGQFIENVENEIHLKEITGNILEKLCMYLYYNDRYTNSTEEIPSFPIEPEIAVELLMAANFFRV